MKRASSPSAFSLIEVTLALGIVSFTLIALLGLCSVALHSSRGSASGTLAPRLVQAVLAKVESEGPPADGELLELYFDETGEEKTLGDDAPYTLTVEARTPDEEAELSAVGLRLRVVMITIRAMGEEQTIYSSLLIQ